MRGNLNSDVIDLALGISCLATNKSGRPVGPMAIADRMMAYLPSYTCNRPFMRYASIHIPPSYHTSREDVVILELAALRITKADRT